MREDVVCTVLVMANVQHNVQQTYSRKAAIGARRVRAQGARVATAGAQVGFVIRNTINFATSCELLFELHQEPLKLKT